MNKKIIPRRSPMLWRLLIMIFVIICSADAREAAKKPLATIKPIWGTVMDRTQQPFSGEARLHGNLGLSQLCTLTVNLVCQKHLDSSATIFVLKSESYSFNVSPGVIVWDAPIDSGATKKFDFTFRPTEVGSFVLTACLKASPRWIPLTTLALAFNEDGKLVYDGPLSQFQFDRVPPHPSRNANPLAISFPPLDSTEASGSIRHFTGTFTFSKVPAVSETTFVDFELVCQFSLYTEVQFLLEHSTTLTPSALPESWGDKAGLNPDFRKYTGRFSFVNMKPGVGFLNFKVMGKNPVFKTKNRITTEFPIYFVIGEDKRLLFLGSFDPWNHFRSIKDKLIASDTELVSVKNREFSLKQISSKPDYLGEEKQRELDADTIRGHQDTTETKQNK